MKSISDIITDEVKKFLAEQNFRRVARPGSNIPTIYDDTPSTETTVVRHGAPRKITRDPEPSQSTARKGIEAPDTSAVSPEPAAQSTKPLTLGTKEKKEVDLTPEMEKIKQRSRKTLGLDPGKVSPVEREVAAEKSAAAQPAAAQQPAAVVKPAATKEKASTDKDYFQAAGGTKKDLLVIIRMILLTIN